jgi:serine/threonine protein kinase
VKDFGKILISPSETTQSSTIGPGLICFFYFFLFNSFVVDHVFRVGDVLEVAKSVEEHYPKFFKRTFLLFFFFFLSRKYIIESLLGKGSFGVVFRCFRPDTYETFAVKLIRNSGKHSSQAFSELRILKEVFFE